MKEKDSTAVAQDIRVAYPGSWFWVNASSNPMRVDPDAATGGGNPAYRALDWVEIARVVRDAVRLVGDEWRPGVVESTVSVSGRLSSEEWAVVHDWTTFRPVVTALSFCGEDPPVRDGQHRLWCAGHVGAYPLPVLMEELQDAALVVGPDGNVWSFDPAMLVEELHDLSSWLDSRSSDFQVLNPKLAEAIVAAERALSILLND
ncbi:hypothetical protein G3T36_18485 [Diaminobutyricibacter tongyongensis]|uniref:Uncharacterized protein n=1 Tax=Leifsonia tongyongensis TaxID=1268043 RepID=A0A6L9Y3P0_9MICO|nr:hypothetical protein [Diaminobutyricibacter tongyongensis]NEN07848.1 hypothetical protein [Diaminobutyricibacter tongyongensis]